MAQVLSSCEVIGFLLEGDTRFVCVTYPTVPLNNLPNGPAEISWTSVDNATGYRIDIYEGTIEPGEMWLDSYSTPPDETSVTVDASFAAIGSGSQFTIRVYANGPGPECFWDMTFFRAAPAGGPPVAAPGGG
jgi:hypothetical protein